MPLNRHLRQKWKEAGYSKQVGSCSVTPPPSRGFRRLYHLTSANHAITSIVFKRLKISRFSDLNDPFELLAANFEDKKVRKIVRDYKLRFNQAHGVLCFSEDWIDPVLWSHYAEKHYGVALGFDVKKSVVKAVSYQPERLAATLSSIKSVKKEVAEALTHTKFESWGYEREWRILMPLEESEREGSLLFRDFDDSVRLREVILGPTSALNLSKVRRLVDHHHKDVVTFKARLAHLTFNIVPDGRTVL